MRALAEPFYGADALVGIWGLSCDRARFQDRRIKRVIVALVGVPTGVTADGLAPLASNLAHALLRIDTDTWGLARALRDRGLPARCRLCPFEPGRAALERGARRPELAAP